MIHTVVAVVPVGVHPLVLHSDRGALVERVTHVDEGGAVVGRDLDAEMIAEEIEQLGISRAHALSSYLKQLTLHLLKWYYQPERRQTGHSWESTILHARQEIADLLEENPGLQPQMEAMLTKAYARARRLARAQTRLPLATFPETCPWPLEQVLDDDFWPEDIVC